MVLHHLHQRGSHGCQRTRRRKATQRQIQTDQKNTGNILIPDLAAAPLSSSNPTGEPTARAPPSSLRPAMAARTHHQKIPKAATSISKPSSLIAAGDDDNSGSEIRQTLGIIFARMATVFNPLPATMRQTTLEGKLQQSVVASSSITAMAAMDFKFGKLSSEHPSLLANPVGNLCKIDWLLQSPGSSSRMVGDR
ncbi:hypothetical protein ACLOJK_017792 [Asimina triloba]